jgi:hypothetical protein
MLWRYLRCWTAFIELPSPTFSPLSPSKQKSCNPSLNWKMENVWLYASVQYFKAQSLKPHTYACWMNKLWEQWNLLWGRFLKTRTTYNSFPLGAITWWTIKFCTQHHQWCSLELLLFRYWEISTCYSRFVLKCPERNNRLSLIQSLYKSSKLGCESFDLQKSSKWSLATDWECVPVKSFHQKFSHLVDAAAVCVGTVRQDTNIIDEPQWWPVKNSCAPRTLDIAAIKTKRI